MSTKKSTQSKATPKRIDSAQSADEKVLYQVVKEVIDTADPESLLKLGAPEDEYDPVSHHMAKRIVAEGGKRLSVTEIANIVAFALHLHFGMWSRQVTFHITHFDIARKLQREIRKAG